MGNQVDWKQRVMERLRNTRLVQGSTSSLLNLRISQREVDGSGGKQRAGPEKPRPWGDQILSFCITEPPSPAPLGFKSSWLCKTR